SCSQRKMTVCPLFFDIDAGIRGLDRTRSYPPTIRHDMSDIGFIRHMAAHMTETEQQHDQLLILLQK
ncbi:MAG: hypothetical protein ACK5QO_07510, partial [Hyphomonadaceae bacterium]